MLDRRQISAVELMTATLARIDALNPKLNAIVSMADPDALMAAARMADATPRKGWLHGIPMAIKDLADAAGFPTTRGTPFNVGSVATADDTMVARLRAAGWHTVAQDEATSVVWGMPGVAHRMGAAVETLPLESIGAAVGAAAAIRSR
jgi:amidase